MTQSPLNLPDPEPYDPPIVPPDDPVAPDVKREPSIDPPPTVPPVDDPEPPGPAGPLRA